MHRIQVIYHGRVQGVGFRATTRSVARGLDVTGWVRNEPDGTVCMQAQGAPDELRRLLDGVHQRLGRGITNAVRTDQTPLEGETDFRITQ